MIRRIHFSIVLMACFSLSLLNAGLINTANAAQNTTKDAQQNSPGKFHGNVTKVINVPGYTYAQVNTGKEKVWAAGPTTPLKTGDMVTFSSQMPMQNFHSKATGRDFPVIYFISRFTTDKKTSTKISPHAQIKQAQNNKPIVGVNKVKGGYTIAEIYTDKSKLKGKTIRVRGKVIRFTANVLGKNWLHIRDSSSLDDLTVTSDGTAAAGDVVIARGKLELNKDYHYGYLYPVIMEQATITKE